MKYMITFDATPNDEEKCPVCGNKGALMNPFVPAPPSKDTLGEESVKRLAGEFICSFKQNRKSSGAVSTMGYDIDTLVAFYVYVQAAPSKEVNQ